MINDPPSPKIWEVTVAAGTGFGGPNLITMPYGVAIFAQITNSGSGSSDNLTVQLNGDPQAVFNLPAGVTQVFNKGDVVINTIDFANHISGGGGATPVQVICGVVNG